MAGRCCPSGLFLFFFNDTATTEIYTLSLHDALPISIGIAWIANTQYLFAYFRLRVRVAAADALDVFRILSSGFIAGLFPSPSPMRAVRARQVSARLLIYVRMLPPQLIFLPQDDCLTFL